MSLSINAILSSALPKPPSDESLLYILPKYEGMERKDSTNFYSSPMEDNAVFCGSEKSMNQNEKLLSLLLTTLNCNSRHICSVTNEALKDKSTEEKGVCFDYLRGECTRGNMCRFNHDLKMIARKYKIGSANNVSDIQRWGQGICFDFVRGACTRGDICCWSHDLLRIAVATKKGVETMNARSKKKIARSVKQKLQSSLEILSSDSESDACSPQSISSLSSSSSSTCCQSSWVPLWDYPSNTFGPLDECGRPLHWFST